MDHQKDKKNSQHQPKDFQFSLVLCSGMIPRNIEFHPHEFFVCFLQTISLMLTLHSQFQSTFLSFLFNLLLIGSKGGGS